MTLRKRAMATLVLALAMLPSLGGIAFANHNGATEVIGGFEIDGDFLFPSGPGLIGETRDWSNVGGVQRIDDKFDDQTDDVFGGGNKEEEPDNWEFLEGPKPPGKDDLTRAYIASDVQPGNAYLWMAFERLDVQGQGDAHVDFELNRKGTTILNGAGELIPERSDGDLLVVYDYAGGTGPVNIEVRMWNGDPDDPTTPENEEALFGTWDIATPAPEATAGEINGTPVARPAGAPFGGGTVDTRRFGEVGLDLDALYPNGFADCPGFSSFWAKSRSSGESFNSQLKDKVGPGPTDVSGCGSITILKEDDSGGPLDGATFELWQDDGNGTFGTGGDTLIGNCVSGEEGTAGQCTFETVDPGTYFVRETAAPDGYVIDPTVSMVTVGINQDLTVSHVYVDPKIQYRMTLTPVEDTNLVDNDHVFTVHLEKSLDGGDSWIDAAGETIDLSLTGEGSITDIDPAGPQPDTCTTDADGECEVTIRSSQAGDSTLEASFEKLTATTPIRLDEDAVKHWVNYRIAIGPEATNLVSTTHTFTVVLEKTTDGSTWTAVPGAEIDVSKTAGPGSITGGTCVTGTTDAAGSCTVTITSNTPGHTTIQASYGAVEGNTSGTFSASEVKHWVDYRITVNPDGVNLVGRPHTFTVLVQQNTGSGWTPVSGEDVDLDWTGVEGSLITAIPGGAVAGDGESGTCTTSGAGTCSVTVNSSAPGSGTLEGTFSTVLDSGAASFDDTATKSWVSYRISVTPEDDTNLLPAEPDHTFVVTVETTEDGVDWNPVVGGTVDLSLSGDVAILSGVGAGGIIGGDGLTGTCVTDAAGQCTVVATTSGPGDTTLTASYEATVGEASVTIDDSGAKTWVTYRVAVTPESATNLVGSDHTFTVTIETTDDGEDWDPVVGVVPELDWDGPGEITGGTCLDPGTDTDGQCTVVVHSDSTGVGTLTAEYLATVGEASSTFGDSGTKTWIDYDILVTPETAANLVDTDHVFTVKVLRDSGDGDGFQPLAGAHPTISLDGPGTITSNTCDDPAGTDTDGQCTVTVTSADPGLTTLEASFEGSADNGTATFTVEATKQWVDYRIDVDPDEAVNPVGTTHTFTVTLEVDTGDGFGPAEEQEVALTLSGPGVIIDIPGGTIAPDGRSGTCITDADGQCGVTITSDEPGESALTAEYGAEVGETSRTFSDDGLKLWVATVKTFTLTVTGIDRAPAGVTYYASWQSVPAGAAGIVKLECVSSGVDTLSCTASVELSAGTYDMKVFYVDVDGDEVIIATFDDEEISGASVENVASFEWPRVLPTKVLPKTGLGMIVTTAGLGVTLVLTGSVMIVLPGRRRRR